MKTIAVYFLSGIALLLAACGTGYQDKIDALEAQRAKEAEDHRMRVRILSDSLDQVMTTGLTEINKAIDDVLQDEGIYAIEVDNDTKGLINLKHHIKNRIGDIETLLANNRARIARLSAKLDEAGKDNKELRLALQEIKVKTEQYEETIKGLYARLDEEQARFALLGEDVNKARAANDSLYHRVTELDDKLSSAFYTVGTFRELKSHGVIEREGGLFSVGGVPALADDFDPAQFTPVDIHTDCRIPLHTRKASLVTEHPSNSYAFKEADGEVAYLEITDPDRFWMSSKFMVIQTN